MCYAFIYLQVLSREIIIFRQKREIYLTWASLLAICTGLYESLRGKAHTLYHFLFLCNPLAAGPTRVTQGGQRNKPAAHGNSYTPHFAASSRPFAHSQLTWAGPFAVGVENHKNKKAPAIRLKHTTFQ